MALAISGTSPAAVTSSSRVFSLTTGSFTPPVGSLVVAVSFFNPNLSSTTMTFSNPTGSLSSWTQTVNFNNYPNHGDYGALVGVAWASVTSSVSTTVKATYIGEDGQSGLKVFVFTGANMTTPIGANSTKTVSVDPTTISYTATAAGSISVWSWIDGLDFDTSGAVSGVTTDATLSTSRTYAKIGHQTTAATGITTQSFSATGMTHYDALCYVEVVPAGGAIGGGTGGGGTGGGTLNPHTMTFTLNAVNVSQYVVQDAWLINQNWGRQGDTAQFVLVDDHSGPGVSPHFTPVAEQPVVLTDVTLGVVLFGGIVTSVWWQYIGRGVDQWTVNCVSYSHWADSRIVSYAYTNTSMGAIITSLTANADCGITTNNVVSGPTITSVSGQFEPLSKAWSKITQMASTATTYGWWVDGSKDLNVTDEAQAVSSGITFTDVPTTSHLNAEGHYDNTTTLEYVWDGTSLANRIYTVGGNVSNTQTDAWTGNGNRTIFALTYPLDTGSAVAPILKVNGAVTVVSTSVTDPWVLVQDTTTGTWSLQVGASAATPVPGSVPISITYGYLITQVSIVQNTTSQGNYAGLANGGYFDATVSDQNLMSLASTQQRGKHELAEYAFPQEQVTFVTTQDWQGWVSVGQTIQFVNAAIPDSNNSYALGINKQFLVVAVRASGTIGGYRRLQITAIRVQT